ncbi:hypothetical protein LJB88_02920 [Erysipelotrichaceae bacterium OttesenSCG-928-M19]|nr:hypothetical protein [Erysipelotrichaceae bacterium OttesenSCG-928-M19]
MAKKEVDIMQTKTDLIYAISQLVKIEQLKGNKIIINTANGIYVGSRVEFLADIKVKDENEKLDVESELFKTVFASYLTKQADEREYLEQLNQTAFIMYDVDVIASKDFVTKYKQIVIFIDEVISISIGDSQSLVTDIATLN